VQILMLVSAAVARRGLREAPLLDNVSCVLQKEHALGGEGVAMDEVGGWYAERQGDDEEEGGITSSLSTSQAVCSYPSAWGL
jgi:hypothetical protein